MFGIRRRRTQGQLARTELNRSVGHLMQAATYASRGVGQTVGPRVRSARGAVAPTAVVVRDRAARGWGSTVATLAPLAVAARGGAAQAGTVAKKAKAKNLRAARPKKKARRRGGMMTGLLAAGAVAGVAGAMAMRRRRDQQDWAEHQPAGTLEPMRDEVETIEVRTPPAPTTGAARTAGTGTAGTAAAGAGTGQSTGATGAAQAGGPTGAGSSAVAKGDSASTTSAATQPVVTPNSQVPSVAEGARDVTGRPADDVSTALGGTTSGSGNRR